MIYRNYITGLLIKYPFLPDYNFSYTEHVCKTLNIDTTFSLKRAPKQTTQGGDLGRYFVKHGHAIKQSFYPSYEIASSKSTLAVPSERSRLVLAGGEGAWTP